MKINWGYSITIVYLVFAVGIMFMVYMTALQNRDLVSENYYEQELAYQKVIDQSANTAALSTPVTISRQRDQLLIELPAEFNGLSAKGKWTLYYAADKEKDMSGEFNTISGKYGISIPQNIKGQFLVKLDWEAGENDYYFEQNIFF
jgi:hypothetical protein